MKKIVLAVALLMLGASVYAEESIVILKKDCSLKDGNVVCDGLVKNIGKATMKDVYVVFTPAPPKDALKKLEEDFSYTSDRDRLVQKVLSEASTPAYDHFYYFPAGETLPLKVQWNTGIMGELIQWKVIGIITQGLSDGTTSIKIVRGKDMRK